MEVRGHGAGHVADAVVHDVVRRRTSGRSASSRARSRSSHPGRSRCPRAPRPAACRATRSSLTRCGAFAPGHQDGADHEVGVQHEPLDRQPADDITVWIRPRWIWSTKRSRSTFVSTIVTSASIPAAIHAAFVPAIPAPRTTTRAGATPAAPPISTPRPPCGRSRFAGPAVRRHAAGDLAHRCEQREPPVGRLHGLVRDRGTRRSARNRVRASSAARCRYVNRSCPVAEPLVLLGLRLLHLHDHVGRGEDRVGVGQRSRRRPPVKSRVGRAPSPARPRSAPRRGGPRRSARGPPRAWPRPGTRCP